MSPIPSNAVDLRLRKLFGAKARNKSSAEIFQNLLAFWPHFVLHKRRCDYSGKDLIGIYPADCPYPVWHRDIWAEKADPPSAEYDVAKPFFEQLWLLFRRCPIPHNTSLFNENCEYSDDWWFSRNCYLCHSGLTCEDCRYCYRLLDTKDSQYCVFTFNSELSHELVNCRNCFSVIHAIDCRNCRDSSFLFDCRDCSECFCCWNLRHKRYCIENIQYSKEEYQRRLATWDLKRRSVYDPLRLNFYQKIYKEAYRKALELERCENVQGNFLEESRDLEDCYFLQRAEDCALSFRGYELKSCLETVSAFRGELMYLTVLAQEVCYDIRYALNVVRCRHLEYCAHCMNCSHCFGCCGLVGKQYHIFNKEYSPSEYEKLVAILKTHIEGEGLCDQYFPPYFAPNSYDESLATVYFPISQQDQQRQGFRVGSKQAERSAVMQDAFLVPDSPSSVDLGITKLMYWDAVYKRPFRISDHDLAFCLKVGVPLANAHYTRTIRELFSWMPFNGELRIVRCAKSGVETFTTLPQQFDSRILAPEVFNQFVA